MQIEETGGWTETYLPDRYKMMSNAKRLIPDLYFFRMVKPELSNVLKIPIMKSPRRHLGFYCHFLRCPTKSVSMIIVHHG
jgi:hypothetical protein